MTLSGTGTSANWITVTSYGSGSRPSIVGEGAGTASIDVLVTNPDYWQFNNLSVSQAGEGIMAWFSTGDHQGLRFTNISSSGIGGTNINGPFGPHTPIYTTYHVTRSSAIEVASYATFSPTQYVDENILLSDVSGIGNQDTVSFQYQNPDATAGENPSFSPPGDTAYSNVTVRGLDLQNGAQNLANGTSDAIDISNITNGTVVDSTINDQCASHTRTGTAAVFTARDVNVNFVNDSITNVPNTGSSDQTGFDFENTNDQTNIVNSYIGGNAGAGVEVLSIHGGATESTNVGLSGNLFVDNGAISNGCRGSICQLDLNHTDLPTGTVSDNLYDEPNGFLSTAGTGSWSDFAISNNAAATSVANAGYDFSGNQGGSNWYYQSSTDGSTWTSFPQSDYVSSLNRWSDGASAIGPYTMFAGEGEVAARTWVAPSSGVINIRGRVLNPAGTDQGNGLVSTAGDPLEVRITENGRTIWPTGQRPAATPASTPISTPGRWQTVQGANSIGVIANVDNISVQKGDQLRFEVAQVAGDQNTPAADTISWDPSIGYVGAPVSKSFAVTSGGSYGVHFSAEIGPGPFVASIDGTRVGTFQSTSGTYASYNTMPTSLTAGTHTLELQELTPSTNTGLISEVNAIGVNTLLDGDFAAPNVSGTPSGYAYDPAGTAWNYAGPAGVVKQYDRPWGTPAAPSGTQMALLQHDGAMSQSVDFTSGGSYVVQFQSAMRTTSGGRQTFEVLVDGQSVGSFSPSSGRFTSYATSVFKLSAGSHTIEFVGTSSGDDTDFIGAVALAPSSPS
ncbi:MAG: hypothetical protein M0004_09055 [Actinomycetota bacterium]|nr:hypothetical protein [Actinomycetota bacterium]